MSFEPRDYLRHMLAEADYLMVHAAGLTREEFLANETLRRAFVRSLEIVGEAAKKVPEDLRLRDLDTGDQQRRKPRHQEAKRNG